MIWVCEVGNERGWDDGALIWGDICLWGWAGMGFDGVVGRVIGVGWVW